MKKRSLLASIAMVVLTACGGSDVTGPTVTSVVVTPAVSTLPLIGATVQLQASARDAAGNAVTGVTATWASADPSVATVSASGLATAVSTGSTAITATISGVAGSGVVTVEQGIEECDAPDQVSLAPGGHAAFDGEECLLLPSGNGHRYRVIVVRPSESSVASDVVTATLNVLGMGVSGSPPPTPAAPAAIAAPRFSSAALLRAAEIAEETSRVHLRLRDQEQELVRRIGAQHLLPSRRSTTLRAPAAVDSPDRIRVDVTTGSDCTTSPGSLRTGFRVRENDDMVIYQDSVQQASTPVSQGQAGLMLQYYSAYARDMLEEYFGAPPDIDGNGKLVVFVGPAASGNTAAFVWSGDFFPAETCPASNEKEIIYFNNDIVQQLTADTARYQALETLAHEAKHVVSLYNRLAATNRLGGSQFHPSWVEEGTAEISGEMSSRIAWAAQGGPAVGSTVSRQDFVTSGGFTQQNYGIAIRLARVVWYLTSQPNGIPVSPDGADPSNSVYGSGWMFHRWLGDAYGGAGDSPKGDASMFRALNDSLAPRGTDGLLQQTGVSYSALLEEFAVAVALHQTAAPEGGGGFATYDFLSGTTIFSNPDPLGDFPWPVTMTSGGTPTRGFNTAQYTGGIGPSGIRIHDLVSNGTGTGAQISLNMASEGRIVVVRLQ